MSITAPYDLSLNRLKLPVVLLAAFALLMILSLYNFIPWGSLNFIIGLMALPFSMNAAQASSKTKLYSAIAIVFSAMACFMPEKTFMYFAIAACMLLITERFVAGVSLVTWLIVFFMSPVTNYLVTVFSFPIRMQLTLLAGSLLRLVGVTAKVTGNVIYTTTSEFVVDPECMGLNMLLSAMLSGLIIVAVMQKMQAKKLSTAWLALIMSFVFACILFANLMRIMLLVYFKLLPGNMMHEIVGLLCFVVYTVLPSLWFIQWLIKKFGTAQDVEPRTEVKGYKTLLLPAALLVLLSAATAMHDQPAVAHATANIEGYERTVVQNDVVKYKSPTALVYYKRIKGALYPEHNPLICWTGCGYRMEGMQMVKTGSMSYYTATLRKDKEQLSTAWWFDNGVHRTASQLEWRWDAIRSAHNYAVINVTTVDEASLKNELENIIAQNKLAPLFK